MTALPYLIWAVESAAPVATDGRCRLVSRPCGGAWTIPLLGRFAVVKLHHRGSSSARPRQEPASGSTPSDPRKPDRRPAGHRAGAARPDHRCARRRTGRGCGIGRPRRQRPVGRRQPAAGVDRKWHRGLLAQPYAHVHGYALGHTQRVPHGALSEGKPESAGPPSPRRSGIRRESVVRGATNVRDLPRSSRGSVSPTT